METQKVDDELETGMELLRKLYAIASQDKRTDIPLSELRVGLKCGGSDGFSGITANPLLGVFSDFLVAQGGTTVLTEVPEMFGAETILMNRSESKAVFEKTVHLINDLNLFIENNSRFTKTLLPAIRREVFPPWKKNRWAVRKKPELQPSGMLCFMVNG